MLGDQVGQTLAEFAVAGRRFDDFEFAGGGLEVGVEEGNVVTVAGGVDADADGSNRRIDIG